MHQNAHMCILMYMDYKTCLLQSMWVLQCNQSYMVQVCTTCINRLLRLCKFLVELAGTTPMPLAESWPLPKLPNLINYDKTLKLSESAFASCVSGYVKAILLLKSWNTFRQWTIPLYTKDFTRSCQYPLQTRVSIHRVPGRFKPKIQWTMQQENKQIIRIKLPYLLLHLFQFSYSPSNIKDVGFQVSGYF